MKQIGSNFYHELNAAGLASLPFTWSENGELSFPLDDKGNLDTDRITKAQQKAILAVLDAHDHTVVPVVDQIKALEALVTDRRIREAILGTDNGWLSGVNAEIAALRKKL